MAGPPQLLGKPAVIVAGDFNSLPGSAAVELATVDHPLAKAFTVKEEEADLAGQDMRRRKSLGTRFPAPPLARRRRRRRLRCFARSHCGHAVIACSAV